MIAAVALKAEHASSHRVVLCAGTHSLSAANGFLGRHAIDYVTLTPIQPDGDTPIGYVAVAANLLTIGLASRIVAAGLKFTYTKSIEPATIPHLLDAWRPTEPF